MFPMVDRVRLSQSPSLKITQQQAGGSTWYCLWRGDRLVAEGSLELVKAVRDDRLDEFLRAHGHTEKS